MQNPVLQPLDTTLPVHRATCASPVASTTAGAYRHAIASSPLAFLALLGGSARAVRAVAPASAFPSLPPLVFRLPPSVVHRPPPTSYRLRHRFPPSLALSPALAPPPAPAPASVSALAFSSLAEASAAMSGVATLKAGAKRGFDEMSIDAPPGPGCSPGRLPLLAPLSKRARAAPLPAPAPCSVAAAASASASAGSSAAAAAAAAAAPHPGAAGAPAVNRPFSAEEAAALAQHVPKRLKRVAEKVAAGQVSISEKIFSVADVREIVESVVAERESRLKDEYTKLLNDRLGQQFRDFTKFNEDHVARQFRDKDFAYLS